MTDETVDMADESGQYELFSKFCEDCLKLDESVCFRAVCNKELCDKCYDVFLDANNINHVIHTTPRRDEPEGAD